MSSLVGVMLVSALVSTAPAETRTVRRFALLLGANDGGSQRPHLRYAVSDAKALSRVLSTLGGVAPADAQVLEEPSVDDVRSTLEQLSQRVGPLGETHRVEVMLYYSGHSDETGLLLKGARLPYGELRTWLASVPASVRIAIFDSCASGAMTREKGGVHVAPFLLDTATQVKGHAILTSSAETEASQESDRLGGSFFTQALLSGMRGAADASHDGRVTLNEAYQFAFDETLARTEKTRSGPQHPAYDIQLAGTGDWVMTDLHGAASTLVLPEPLLGRYFVRDADGRLVAELRKFAGRFVELGLEPGTYQVTRELDGSVAQGTLALESGNRVPLDDRAFTVVKKEATTARGDEPSAYDWVPVDVSILPQLSVNGSRRVVNNLSISLLAGRSARLDGVAMTIAGHRVDEVLRGAQLTVGLNSVGGETTGAQLSVAANLAGGDVLGVQSTVGFNLAPSLTGAQLAVGGSLTTATMTGVQAAVGASVAKDVVGAQLATGAAVAWRSLRGAQLTAGFAFARGAVGDDLPRSVGAQLSAGGNWVAGRLTGAQLSGGFNYAGSLSGAQLAVVNIGGDIDGAQLGVVNIARKVRGTQLGVINIAAEVEGESVGLLSIAGNGQVRPEAWVDDTALVNVGIKLGTKRVYTLLTAGIIDGTRWASGLALGGHVRVTDSFSVDVDALARDVRPYTNLASSTLWTSARAVVHYRVLSRLSVFAGPTFNLAFAFDGSDPRVSRIAPRTISLAGRPTSLWVGAVIGVGI